MAVKANLEFTGESLEALQLYSELNNIDKDGYARDRNGYALHGLLRKYLFAARKAKKEGGVVEIVAVPRDMKARIVRVRRGHYPKKPDNPGQEPGQIVQETRAG